MESPKKPVDIRTGSVLRAYTRAVTRYPGLLFSSVVTAIGVEALNVVAPLYLRDFINLLTTGSPSAGVIAALFITLALYGGITFFGWVFRRISQVAVAHVEARTMVDLFNGAFSKLLHHSHEFFISNFTGTLTRRVTRYARSFEQVYDNVIFNFLPTIAYVIGIVIVLSLRSLTLGMVLLAWTVLFVYLQFVMTRRLQSLRVERSEADSKLTGSLSDAVSNHSAITAFAAVDREQKTFASVVSHWYEKTIRSWVADNWINGIQGLLAMTIEIGLLAGAVFFWQKGIITVGDFVLIQVYVLGLFDRIWGIGRNMRQLYDAFAEATEMLDIIELPIDIADVPNATSLAVREGKIDFDHVRFTYRGDQAVLEDLSLVIEPHQKVALVGPSGAGKSTVTRLLLRLYEVTSGEIRIDGQNIAHVTQESLRRAISLVPQEPVLFHRTLLENIRYGRADATDEEVIEAARQAHCYEFIHRYPEGFETLVGERGVKLSGGERQRIAIARAILKNAPILVLDEATSSLDSESEALIQDALARLMEGKTVIAIAHRLSTVMKMDRIVVMENGKVAITGSHDELLAHEGNLYKKLWEIQAGGFLSE